MPTVYSASRESRIAYGVLSTSSSVVSSTTLVDWKSMICESWPPAESGASGSATRWMLNQASSAVTSLPLWKVTPWRSLMVQVMASADGSTDSASAGSSS